MLWLVSSIFKQHKLDYVCSQTLKSGSIRTMACLRILVKKAKFMVVCVILLATLLALNASPPNKCQHIFQPGELFARQPLTRYFPSCRTYFLGQPPNMFCIKKSLNNSVNTWTCITQLKRRILQGANKE